MRRNRRGLAVVELAVCLPILMLLVFGTLEACSMIHLKQSLSLAAYEGARLALVPGATSADAQSQTEQILTDRRVTDFSVTVSPDVGGSPEGTIIQVTAEANCSGNSIVGDWFYDGKSLKTTVQMMKEFD
ncbi:MAG: TadE/TadG family type IV pilus assembly protein [Planctomycetota bacterium]